MTKQNLIFKMPVFKCAWPNLWKPYSFAGSKLRYGVTALYEDHSVLDTFKAMLLETGRGRFGEESTFRIPIKPGKMHTNVDLSKYIQVTMTSGFRPYLRDAVDELETGYAYTCNEETFYHGALCTAEVLLFSYDSRGYQGVGANILSVTKVGEEPMTEDEAAFYANSEIVLADIMS